MKKFFMILAAALCLAGCSTSSDDVIYDIKPSYSDFSISSFNNSTREAYNEINTKLKEFSNEYCKEWIATISNGKFSSEDKSAKSQFNTAAKAFESVKSECEAIVNSLPSNSYDSFTIEVSLILKRYNDGADHILDSKDAKFVYGDDGGNAAI